MSRAVIFMGSKVDYPHVAKIEEWLDKFGVAHEARVASAHKTPGRLLALVADYEKRDEDIVYIAVAGLSNALSGALDFATRRPVISCPPPCDQFGGADLYSSLRNPPGVAACLVLDPRNAALFAAKVLALAAPGIGAEIEAFQAEQVQKIAADDASLAGEARAGIAEGTL